MMKQYWKVKEAHPDCLLFFRLGDFYEMFHDDAKLGAEELGLTLTTRDRGKPEGERTPMCGVPYHSAQSYIARLIKRGYKVAICEQMEDPATAKGLVDRDVIRIVTPGTAMADEMLDESRNNYICAVYAGGAGAALARCDLSTGAFTAAPFQGKDCLTHLLNALAACPPSEAILSDGAADNAQLTDFLKLRLGCLCQGVPEARFRPAQALEALAALGILEEGERSLPDQDGLRMCYQAAGALAGYLKETQKTDLSHLGRLTVDGARGQRYLELDLTARRTLELTETIRGSEKKGSLLWVLDKTRTPMGHRLIRAWIEQPLCDPDAISFRQDQVAALTADGVVREELSRALFGGFVRRQVVVQCRRRENGAWVVRDDPFVDDWSEEDYRVLTDCLGRTIKRGGFAYAAFLDGVLKGFASVEPEPMGPEGEYLDLSSIHVSEDVRGRGIGRELFQAAKGWAWAHGGKKLYISAHSAVETQAFYRAMGCVDAQFIHQGHAAAEPFDCQLECELSEIGACER